MADKKQLELQDDKPYYPIFYKSLKVKPKAIKEEHERKRRPSKELQNTLKRPKLTQKETELHASDCKEQLYLDFGQQHFGHVQCDKCDMIYMNGQLEDAREHYKYHVSHCKGNSISFKGWKYERVVERYSDGRIILVLPTDHKRHLKKIEEIVRIVDQELGYAGSSSNIKAKSKSFLYVSNQRKVVGYVMAEAVSEAYEMRVSPDDSAQSRGEENWSCMSEVPKKSQLGISRVWVSSMHRRNGYASKLLDAARQHFFFAHTVPKDMIAFSDPTVDGGQLAMSYSMSDCVLVYKWSP